VTALSTLPEILALAAGSALGATARFALGDWALRAGWRHPLMATLAVNLSGSAAAGCLAGWSMAGDGQPAAAIVLAGFLGSYTTVSSFSLESLGLWAARRRLAAAGYVLLSAGGSPLLAWAAWSVFLQVGAAA